MSGLFLIRAKLTGFFKNFETWFRIIGKFAGMMLVFTMINEKIGYNAVISTTPVSVLLSLICSIIPGSFCVVLAAVFVVLQLIKLSEILAILTGIVMVVLYLLFLKFAPEQSFLLLAVPVLMQFDLHFALPLIAGVYFSPFAIIPIAAGFFMKEYLHFVVAAAPVAGTGLKLDLEAVIEALTQIVTSLAEDKMIVIYLFVCVVALAVMYVVTRFSFSYSWYAGILAGALAQIAAAFFCTSAGVTFDMNPVFMGTIAGFVVAVILQFFKCAVDYSRKEYLQFEDEDYYYYVKAIPKVGVSRKAKPKKEIVIPDAPEAEDVPESEVPAEADEQQVDPEA